MNILDWEFSTNLRKTKAGCNIQIILVGSLNIKSLETTRKINKKKIRNICTKALNCEVFVFWIHILEVNILYEVLTVTL